MNEKDTARLLRLRNTFDKNYAITGYYARYISSFPELITREMVDTLTADGSITRTDAVAAILAEIFGLDIDKDSGDDKSLIMDYIYPSIRFPDAKNYVENPYYKKIAPRETVTDGDVEFRWEYYPPYRAAISGDLTVTESYREIPPIGFFEEGFSFPCVLEGGNEWMTLTPVDVDTCEDAIKKSHGAVVTFGLGLGYFAYMASMRDEVDSVTIVEQNESVIRLFNNHVLPKFERADKIRVIHRDAFEYAELEMPREHFDYAFVDTWRDASDGLVHYTRMKPLEKLSPSTEFDYWIENFILSRRRAERFEELWEKYESGAEDAPRSYAEFTEELERLF